MLLEMSREMVMGIGKALRKAKLQQSAKKMSAYPSGKGTARGAGWTIQGNRRY